MFDVLLPVQSCSFQRLELRLLKPSSRSSEDAARFLSAYASPLLLESHEGRVYACRKCYAKLEKGYKTVDAIQAIVNDLRGALSLLPVAVTVKTAFGESEMCTSSVQQTILRVVRTEPALQHPIAAVPPTKKARKNLSYSLDSANTRELTTTVQTPEVKVHTCIRRENIFHRVLDGSYC